MDFQNDPPPIPCWLLWHSLAWDSHKNQTKQQNVIPNRWQDSPLLGPSLRGGSLRVGDWGGGKGPPHSYSSSPFPLISSPVARPQKAAAKANSSEPVYSTLPSTSSSNENDSSRSRASPSKCCKKKQAVQCNTS